MSKRCIIFSQGPVPTPEHTKVEGGGLRCWGLAKGILANDPEAHVTVAYHDSYKQEKFTNKFEGINITTWDANTIPELVQQNDSVIVSYCMADLPIRITDAIGPHQQLILDCYVPIYVEVSARNSDDVDREYNAFHHDVGRWAHALRRGDLFLVASEQQKRYYMGVLSGLGRINPVTYGEDLIKIVPYGIYRDEPKANGKPIAKLVGSKDSGSKKILWFGGIYPWFDLRTLVDAISLANEKLPTKLVIVGAKNPFNAHPDFISAYEKLLAYVNEDPARKEHVIFQDWVKFEERADWYLDSDLVVVINKLGDENELAWRTRLVDYMWADLPIITNGGDPLGEILLGNKAAVKLHGLSAKDIGNDLVAALGDKENLATVKKNLAQVKQRFYWDVATKDLTKSIASHERAADLEKQGSFVMAAQAGGSKLGKIKRAASKSKMIPGYARKYGMKNTYHAIRTKVKNRMGGKLGMNRTEPGIVMISHQLDFSGAPYVFMDLAETIKKETKNIPLEFHTFNPALKQNISRLNKAGITPNVHISRDIGIAFIKGDTAVLNTVGHSPTLKNSVYASLESNILKKLVWFIHEDEPELLFDSYEAIRVKKLIKANKIVIYIAADKTLQNYQKFFDNKSNIRKQPYKYVIPEKFQKVRGTKDFDKLSFILPGTVSDGRKGQLPVFYAFGNFLKTYFEKQPDDYREFELVYVGVESDFLSRQMLKHAKNLLGKRFKHYGRVTHERSSELMMQSNMTVCYSLRECLPLFVFEGMAAGHPILRNDSSGIDEQLFEGKNGYLLDSADFNQIVEVFEQVLNKQKTTNKQLADMSAYSNKVALNQAKHTYKPMVDEIVKDID